MLIIVAAIISEGIWYFEGVHEFRFLTERGEIVPFLGPILFVAIIPIGLFYYLNDKDNFQNKARQISLLGFIPSLVLLVFLIA